MSKSLNHRQLRAVTADALACRKCVHNANATLLLSPWAPPRGWAGAPTRSIPIDLVIVALNPGAPLDDERAAHWRLKIRKSVRAATGEQIDGINAYCLAQYQSPKQDRNGVFHRKSVALARALLWMLDGSDPGHGIWPRVWFTDLFKCSTMKESGPRITKSALDDCRPYLERELSACSPRLVVTLGKRAKDALGEIRGYRHVAFRHPSNGCPRWEAPYHDEAFRAAAQALGVGRSDTASLRRIREQVLESAPGSRS